MTDRISVPDMTSSFMWLTASQPMMRWMTIQGEISSRLGEIAATWGQNRLDDAEAAQNAVRRMSGTRDVNEITAICSDWLRGTMERAAREVSQFTSQTQGIVTAGLSGAHHMPQHETATGKDAPQRAAKAAE